jgi:hypothetical protein
MHFKKFIYKHNKKKVKKKKKKKKIIFKNLSLFNFSLSSKLLISKKIK